MWSFEELLQKFMDLETRVTSLEKQLKPLVADHEPQKREVTK